MKKVIETYLVYPPKPSGAIINRYQRFTDLKKAKRTALKLGAGSTIFRKVTYKNVYYTDIVWEIVEETIKNKIYKYWRSYYAFSLFSRKVRNRKLRLISMKGVKNEKSY